MREHWSALASLGMRGLGVMAGFVVTFVIGRWYGPAANGQYALVTQTAMFLSVVAVGGLDIAVTREFARAAAANIGIARGSLWRVTGQTLAFALALSAAVAVGGAPLLELIGRGSVPAGSVLLICVILLSRAFTRIGAAILRSQRDYVLSQAVEVLLIPLLTVIILATGQVHSLSGILWATAASGVIAAVVGVIAMERHTAPGGYGIDIRAVYRLAWPLWGAIVVMSFADWFSLVTISGINGLAAAGLFRVAVQISGAFAILGQGLFATFVVQISMALHEGDRARAVRLCGSATRMATLLVLPAMVLGLTLAPQVLGLIGPQFRSGATMLRILIVGQAIAAATGITGLALAIIGDPRRNLIINVVSFAVMLVLGPLAARFAGPETMCALVAAILVGRNAAAAFTLIRHNRMDVLRGRFVGDPDDQ